MIVDFLAQLPAIVLAISIHEYGHGLVAYLLGDDTAKNEGRMTLNPSKHIDPIGLFIMFIAHFGWAKPVPIDESKFKNRRLGLFLVSLAGPVFNVILAVISIYLLNFEKSFVDMYALNLILEYMIEFNILFAAFNLIPIPPLDGSKIILSMLPYKMHYYYYKHENIGSMILLALIFTNTIKYLIGPAYVVIKIIVSILGMQGGFYGI